MRKRIKESCPDSVNPEAKKFSGEIADCIPAAVFLQHKIRQAASRLHEMTVVGRKNMECQGAEYSDCANKCLKCANAKKHSCAIIITHKTHV